MFVGHVLASMCRTQSNIAFYPRYVGCSFREHFVLWGKELRVVEADPFKAIVLPVSGNSVGIELRKQDVSWKQFLSIANQRPRSNHYSPVYRPIDSTINILFSSGTTGEPKAIPWTQLSPIRCSADGWAHNDIRAGDVYCWPTNLGWVMGPVVLFTCFLNGATLALYHGSPLGRGFGKFIQVIASEEKNDSLETTEFGIANLRSNLANIIQLRKIKTEVK
ncbi:hypothetical protein Goarm_010988 [Gossypium armourianum]|uniref:AMP-dependent synthetase/ligase domain-containing protein n=1 Tax=Gossypium armourianum TaxID=34283 RepID=A0A7J9IVE1_9ROSI|nr:hypothetical protein [Gossypium armourianum]